MRVTVMARLCDRCRKKVSLRDSFQWQGKSVCGSCLSNLQSGRKWFDQPVKVNPLPPLKSLALAGMLAVACGPFGMLYVRCFWRAMLGEVVFLGVIVSGIMLISNSTVFLIFILIAWIVHVIWMPMWAVRRARELNGQIESKSLPG
jgi:hypothetical protein